MDCTAHNFSAVEAAARIRAGTLTSEALVAACLARIEARESEVRAWEYLDADAALAAARAADRMPAAGPLHGVPIGVKDIIDTFDMPTGLGSPLYAGRRPQWDAACVAAARAAGAIVLGKTVSTEFAYFTPGKTRNPHNAAHTPGGSSSGSAAAVADRMVPLAFGSQTAASVIRPAAYCGVYGYKASFGELSLSGLRPFSESLDTLGIIARDVADIALMRSVLLGASDVTADATPRGTPVIGVCRTAQWAFAEPPVHAAIEASGAALRRAGAAVREVVLPPHYAALIDAQKTIMAYEAARNYVYETTRHPQAVSDAFRSLCDTGQRIARGAYIDAKRAVVRAAAELPAIVGDCDVLLTPAALGEAPLASIGTGDPLMSRMWTALHVPCLAVPAGRGPHGLPIAIQLIGADGDDERLLRVGAWVGANLAAA
jgi:amidase